MINRIFRSAAAANFVAGVLLLLGAFISAIGSGAGGSHHYEDAWGMFWSAVGMIGFGAAVTVWLNNDD